MGSFALRMEIEIKGRDQQALLAPKQPPDKAQMPKPAPARPRPQTDQLCAFPRNKIESNCTKAAGSAKTIAKDNLLYAFRSVVC